MKVLLAEDDKKTRTLFKKILLQEGFEVFEASNGKEALNLYESFIQKPDIIIIDQCMPQMSGISVTQEILQRYSNESKIFMLTSDSTINLNGLEDRITLRTKPVSRNDFIQEIQKIVQT